MEMSHLTFLVERVGNREMNERKGEYARCIQEIKPSMQMHSSHSVYLNIIQEEVFKLAGVIFGRF